VYLRCWGDYYRYSLIVSRRNRGLVSDAKVLAGQLRANHSTLLGAVMNDG